MLEDSIQFCNESRELFNGPYAIQLHLVRCGFYVGMLISMTHVYIMYMGVCLFVSMRKWVFFIDSENSNEKTLFF